MKTYIEKNKDKLKELFKNVYFITGTATGGKTTISKEIANKYGFIRYDVDEEFDKHQKSSNEIDQPAMNKEFKNADEFFLRDKYEYVNWLLKNRKEQLDFVLEDIANLAKDNIVVCDIHLDVEEARLITDKNHIVFLIKEDNKHIIEDYINRKSHEGFKNYIYSSSNPEKAKENCNEVLRIINEEKCNIIKNSEFRYIERNNNSTVENTLDEVENIFNLKEEYIPDLNIFMQLDKLNKKALSNLNDDYYIRNCRPEEIDIWKEFPFDNELDKKENYQFMTNYYNDVYKKNEEEFYNRCLFVCEKKTDKPVATCFLWKAYGKINTIHWFKTLKEYEGKGIGRALLSYILKDCKDTDYPIFLHTQPGSYKAIGLYSDFGFKIITNHSIGNNINGYKESLIYLKYFMKDDKYEQIQYVEAPSYFDEEVKKHSINEF